MLNLLVLLVAVVASATAVSSPHFYRRDYTFIEEFNAYYKLHWNQHGVSWNDAFITCDDEGAKLFYPKEHDEWTVVKNLTSAIPVASNGEPDLVTDVIVGIHDEIGQGEFVTVDGGVTPSPVIGDQPVPHGQDCIIMDIETGEYKVDSCLTNQTVKRVFVCKKVDEKPCRTIDLGYKYSKEAKKCYKINERERTWQEAWRTCYMEGGLLVSATNDIEAKVLSDMIDKSEVYYFSGFRRIFSNSDFYTVKGQKLHESGYEQWIDNENTYKYDCGAVYRSSSYRSLYMLSQDCQNRLPFICEMPASV